MTTSGAAATILTSLSTLISRADLLPNQDTRVLRVTAAFHHLSMPPTSAGKTCPSLHNFPNLLFVTYSRTHTINSLSAYLWTLSCLTLLPSLCHCLPDRPRLLRGRHLFP
eukprot:TRINITY_DN3710_c0_g1_i9.p1 TRINITY_DN3710_c0_g1~~TRINITY_DN3710_c0_g1_i9.p1  ORF type:complete len:110 (+),score=4.10 TRINITY_DN3710_c0_g1_i9:189-518(+)